MHWVLQHNLFEETAYARLVDYLKKYQIPYDIVKVVPFSHELIPDINPEGLVYVCGSTSMMLAAKDKNWFPGSFYNDKFDAQVWMKKYDCLNNVGGIVPLSGVTDYVEWDEFFIRPTGDLKQFNGTTMGLDEFDEWYEKLIEYQDDLVNISLTTPVVVAPILDIQKEFRLFVVDKTIITGSLYKLNDKVVYDNQVDESALKFAEVMIDRWTPARAFVLDICMIDDKYKVIEINNINSAGFYESDVSKLIQAIEGMNF